MIWNRKFLHFFGVLQGSVLDSMLNVLYTLNLPVSRELTVVRVADDTTIMAINEGPILASGKLQEYLILLEDWLRK
jgi:hypothetical protein